KRVAAQCARRRNREHAAAGAEVEHAARMLRAQEVIEREQAPARRAMVAGAEGERRRDLDTDLVDRYADAVVRAMYEEAPSRDRPQSGEARPHPVLCGDALEAQRVGGRRPGDESHERTHGSLVRW